MRRRSALFVLWLLPLAAFAQREAGDPCAAVAALQIPEADRPTLAQAVSAGAPCDAFSVYYQSHASDRWQKARFCALAQLGLFRAGTDPARAKAEQTAAAHGATEPADLGQAEGLTLAMLYANGEGAPRNSRVAESLVCRFGFDGPQANASQLPVLLKALEAGQRFDLCGEDREPQGRSIWYACTAVDLTRAARAIERERAAAARAITPAAQPLLRALQAAWKEFSDEDSQLNATLCDGGTGCGVISEQDDLAADRLWLAQLGLIASRTLPADLPPAGEYARLDKALNEQYRSEIEERKESSDMLEQTRSTERAWLRFRDAWVKLAAQRWTDVPADCWRGWLTAQWTEAMQNN